MQRVKIGKAFCTLVYVLIACAQLLNAADIQLRVVSDAGNQISRIAVGAPCMVELIIPGAATVTKRPVIPGIDPESIMREQESVQMQMGNGVNTHERTISYLVSFPEVGTIRLGPARVMTSQGELFSSEVTLEVQEVSAPASSQENFVFAELQLEKQEAFLQEAIPYTIRFYYTQDAVQQVTLQPFSVPNCEVVQAANVRQGDTTYHATPCKFAEWSGVLYPERAGRITIPRIIFQYTQPHVSSATQHQWAHFMHMLAPSVTHKQQTTQPVSVTIKPLPPTTEFVCGVGTISHVSLSFPSDTVTQGESLVGTLQIVGNAHMPSLKLPPLQVPEALRVYPSHAQEKGTYPHYTKTNEYIVQGLEAGSWLIPEQRYVFFDPAQAQYKVFVTPARTIYVMPSTVANNTTDADKDEDASINDAEDTDTPVVNIPLVAPANRAPFMPLWLFISLMLAPVLWTLSKKQLHRWYAQIQKRRARRRAFRTARHELQKAADEHDPYAFLTAWRKFLDSAQLPAQMEHEWNIVMHEIEATAFSKSGSLHLRTLLHQAYEALVAMETALHKRGTL